METFDILTVNKQIITANFFAAANPNQIVIIASATGVKQSYYKYFASYLAEQNISVISFDYFGIGHSKKSPLRKNKSKALDWGKNDLESVLKYTIAKFPYLTLTVIGHSIGGQLIGLASSSSQIHNIILVAAQSGYWKFWHGLDRFKMLLNWYIYFPILSNFFGYLPASKFSAMEDLPKGVALEWRNWCLKANYLFDYINRTDLYFESIKCNIKSYSISDDDFASKEAVDWLSQKYSNSSLERAHLQPKDFNLKKIGHFGPFKSEQKDIIWPMLLADIKIC